MPGAARGVEMTWSPPARRAGCAAMAPTVGNTLRRTWWMPLLCYGLALWLARTEPVRLFEARTLDWRTRYRAFFQPPPDPRIVIALFEDDTETKVAPWPVDR